MNEKIEKAIKILAKNLGSEKELGKPVLLHSLRVGFNLLHDGYGEDIVLAGFLHDIIEDSDVGEEIIEKEFGKNILDLILANSKNYSIPKGVERDMDLFNRCIAFGRNAMIIKGYDIFDNYYYFLKANESTSFDRITHLLYLFLEKIGANNNETIFQKLRDIKNKELIKDKIVF